MDNKEAYQKALENRYFMKTEKQILSIITAACAKEREAMKAGDAAAVERLDALTTLTADIVLTPEEMSAEDKALNTAAYIYIEQAYDDTSKLTDEDKQTIIRDFKAGSRWEKERLRAVLESAIAAVRAVEALAAAFNPKPEEEK